VDTECVINSKYKRITPIGNKFRLISQKIARATIFIIEIRIK